MKTKLYFSVNTGEIYEVWEDEEETLDHFQVPLISRPKSNCKQCYGRFHVGFNMETEMYAVCSKCSKKYTDWEKLRLPAGLNN